MPSGDDDRLAASPGVQPGMMIECIVISVNLYLAVAFLLHGRRTNMWKSRSKADMHRGMVYKMAIPAVLLPFLRYCGTMLFMIATYVQHDIFCEGSADAAYLGLMFGITPTYAFMWARQRAFYGHPSLSDRYGCCLAFISKYILVPIILNSVVSVVLALYPVEYKAGQYECVLIDTSDILDYRVFVYAGVFVSSQVVLLGLFIHPIVVHMKSQRNMYQEGEESERSASHRAGTVKTKKLSADTGNSHIDSLLHDMSHSEVVDKNQTKSKSTGVKKGEVQAVTASKSDKNTQESDANGAIRPVADQKTDANRNLAAVREADQNDSSLDTSDRESESSKTGSHTPFRGRSKFRSVVANVTRHRTVVRELMRRRRETVRARGKVMKLIKRTLWLGLVSVVSDVMVMVASALWSQDISETMQFVMYDISLLINVVTVIASFDHFSRILGSPVYYCIKAPASGTGEHSSSH